MNANELADELDKYKGIATRDAATMLRQQQAELDAFKLQYYNTGYSIQLRDKDETIRQQQAEIEALKTRIERMVENASHHEGIAHAGGFELGHKVGRQRDPLTDQELLKMAADKFHYTEYKLAIEFARAIERAHGIGELP